MCELRVDNCSHLDILGNKLEKEGVEPGCIFEFHFSIHPTTFPGGVVESVAVPGVKPTWEQIKRVLVMREDGGIEEATIGMAMVMIHLPQIIEDLC